MVFWCGVLESRALLKDFSCSIASSLGEVLTDCVVVHSSRSLHLWSVSLDSRLQIHLFFFFHRDCMSWWLLHVGGCNKYLLIGAREQAWSHKSGLCSVVKISLKCWSYLLCASCLWFAYGRHQIKGLKNKQLEVEPNAFLCTATWDHTYGPGNKKLDLLSICPACYMDGPKYY